MPYYDTDKIDIIDSPTIEEQINNPEKMQNYAATMAEKYHVDDDSPKTVIFKAVKLSNLNEWLRYISLDEKVNQMKKKIEDNKAEIKKKEIAYLESIKPYLTNIESFNREIEKVKMSQDLEAKSKRIQSIIEEAVSQDPELVAASAKDVLIGKHYDPIININMMTTLSEEEKEELYQQYLNEMKRLAGII